VSIGGRVQKWIAALCGENPGAQKHAAEKILDLNQDYFIGRKKLPVENKIRLLASLRIAADKTSEPLVIAACSRLAGELKYWSADTQAILQRGLDEPEATTAALAATGKIGPEAESLADIIAGLRSSEFEVRFRIGWALGRIGKGSDRIISTLISLADDPHSTTSGFAVEALGHLARSGDARIAQTVFRKLSDQDGFFRGAAVRAAAKSGGDSSRIAEKIAEIARSDSSENIRFDAAMAIVDLGLVAKSGFRVARKIFADLPDRPFSPVYLEKLDALEGKGLQSSKKRAQDSESKPWWKRW
jgi:hypothetical protein